MIKNTKRIILLQVILFTLIPVSLLGQNDYAIKQRIQESLEEFMSMISYVNDEEEVMLPSDIAARFGNVNYFLCNGKEKKLQAFIEDYCYSDLQRHNINHTLNISLSNIKKFSNEPSDQRWSVNGVLKREFATNEQGNIADEEIAFTILWRGTNEEIGLLELNFHSILRMSSSNVKSQSQANQIDVSHIGDIMEVNGEKYTIAYLTDNKKHGFAIRDIGVHGINTPTTLKYLSDQMIPTLVEMDTIYKNNEHIGLTGKYWTSTKYKWSEGPWSFFYEKDFLTGKTSVSDQRNKNRMLIIHRF